MLATEGNAVFCLEMKTGQRLRTGSLVLAIKCHSTSALLASAVLSCASGETYTGFCWRILREGDHFADPGLDVKIMLRWILKKWVWEYRLNRTGSRYGQMAGTC